MSCEDLREIYEEVPNEYLEVFIKTLLTERFGCTVEEFYKVIQNPFRLGEFFLTLQEKAEELGKGHDIVIWLSTEDEHLIDRVKLHRLIIAMYYYFKCLLN
jgi:hypothetical protein